MKASGCPVADWMLRLKPMAKDVRRRRAIAPVSRKAIAKRPRAAEQSRQSPAASAASAASAAGEVEEDAPPPRKRAKAAKRASARK